MRKSINVIKTHSWVKEKNNHMSFSADAEKASYNLQQHFRMQRTRRTRRKPPQHGKGHTRKATANGILNSEKMNSLPPSQEPNQERGTFLNFIQNSTRHPKQKNEKPEISLSDTYVPCMCKALVLIPTWEIDEIILTLFQRN